MVRVETRRDFERYPEHSKRAPHENMRFGYTCVVIYVFPSILQPKEISFKKFREKILVPVLELNTIWALQRNQTYRQKEDHTSISDSSPGPALEPRPLR